MGFSLSFIVLILLVVGFLSYIFGPNMLSYVLARTRSSTRSSPGVPVARIGVLSENLEAAVEYSKPVLIDLRVSMERRDISWNHIKVCEPQLRLRVLRAD